MKAKLLPISLAAIASVISLAGCIVYKNSCPRDERHPYRQELPQELRRPARAKDEPLGTTTNY